MRMPSRARLTSGTEYLDITPSSPEERAKVDWGIGGLAIGLFAGLLAGSQFTFHSPVRRRSPRIR